MAQAVCGKNRTYGLKREKTRESLPIAISLGKISKMFMFSINCFIVMNDVLLRELRLKQVDIIKFHVLYNLMIKRSVNVFIGEILESSCMLKTTLTLTGITMVFLQTVFKKYKLYIKNMILQMIILINRTKEIVYRNTVQKTIISNTTIKSKLDNPVRIYIFINSLSLVKNLLLSKVFFNQLINIVTGNRIVIKTFLQLQNNSNSHTYRCKRNLLTFELDFHLTTIRCFTTNIVNKSVYIDKSLTKSVKFQLKLKKWITFNQKKSLIKYVEICQTNLFVLSTQKNCLSKVFYLMELLIHSLLFQVYAIETFFRNKESQTSGIDNQIWMNTPKSKIKLLAELKHFRNRKPLFFKWVYISKKNDQKCLNGIPSIIDRLIQQLFVLVLNPFVEANSDLQSYGFRKNRNQIMVVGAIQKNLQSKLKKSSKNSKLIFIWNADIIKYFDFINHKWLLKHAPFPFKYKYILKSWLKLRFIKFRSNKMYKNDKGISQSRIISPLLMNFILNGMETLVNESIIEYNKVVFKSPIKKFLNGKIKLLIKHRWLNGSFKKYQISCKLYRYADDFIFLCGSKRLLALIKKKFIKFLQSRGLQIHFKKSKTILFKNNTPFDFLGYTFIYLICTKHIKNKLLHENKLKYRLQNRPRLFVYPSRSKVNIFKKHLKTLIKYNQNSSAYVLISILNPIIRGWVNYYSFSNARGVLNLLRHWLYNRIVFWMKRKHSKSSITWLKKQYLLMENIIEQHNLKNDLKTIKYIINIKSINQVQQNRWNFYGIAWRNNEGFFYKIPRINVCVRYLFMNKCIRIRFFYIIS